MSSVARALARRGLLLPQRHQAAGRQLARARRAVFLEPPTRRCRVWQSDFSEFETIGGGIWRLCGVVDYVAKVSLACPVTTTQTAVDAIAALEVARLNADTWLGHSLLEECLHPETGEVLPIAIVTDNGAAFRSAALRSLHRLAARVHPRPYSPPLAPDQRRHRALLPGSQVRVSLPQ